MKALRLIILWIWCLAYMALAQTNGDFSAGLTGWTATGSVSAQNSTASFNGTATEDTPNDGQIVQSLPTSTTYTITFDLGATGSAMGEQRIDLNGQVFTIVKTQPGTHWKSITATITAASLTFRDVSTITNGIDLLLDNVVVTVAPVTSTLAPCKLAWNPQPNVQFRVWRGIELLATVATNEATVTLPDDILSTVTVSAFTPADESTQSAPMIVQPVTSWETADLSAWSKITTGFIEFNPLKRFFRHSYPLTPTP